VPGSGVATVVSVIVHVPSGLLLGALDRPACCAVIRISELDGPGSDVSIKANCPRKWMDESLFQRGVGVLLGLHTTVPFNKANDAAALLVPHCVPLTIGALAADVKSNEKPSQFTMKFEKLVPSQVKAPDGAGMPKVMVKFIV
jgi:hypothetical protein